jgi:nicotinate-nucleotide pyrophosphorylase (carboxylating)
MKLLEPMIFTEAETRACQRLVDLALQEDLGDAGDLTSQAIIPEILHGQAVLIARAPGILAGLPAAEIVLKAVEPRLRLEGLVPDGTFVQAGRSLARISGPMRGILAAERTALNFLQHLSGIATLTRRYVDAIEGLPAKILDTRKTTPGWRLLEKYAVRQGGGHNHRMGLQDGILIKDNHLAVMPATDPITRAVEAARTRVGISLPVEIEVDSLDQFDLALDCRPDIILLDNMSLDQMREAVSRRDAKTGDERSPGGPQIVLLEASGGITLANVRAVAETGVDRISIGALTHSAPALDIALDYETNQP